MPNSKGINGFENGNCPPDEILEASLLQYAKEGLTVAQKLRRLGDEHNFHIKATTLKVLHRRFKVPSVRKPPAPEQAAQLILNKVAADTNGLNGAGYIKSALADEGHLIPRATVRRVILDNVPEAVEARYPGQKKLKRTQLNSIGVFADVAADGHDKGNALGLQMGSVSLPIYGYRDRWSGAILFMRVVPNDRQADVVGHVYLDFVGSYGAIPITLTVDKGSETGEMFAIQTSLRKNFAPDLCLDTVPALVALKSIHNTSIEGIWHWLRKTTERNFIDEIKRGYNDGIFNPNDDTHV